ncbi:hypothetical protein CC85DRAFT_6187 [Cutaneotrichosporon oleaginosum]|uniref:Uncharacterized protein n=1 Tax=Cutaneotrichosporon oleaginosum TaxID=879819 RepID=A0A0J0XZV8_9TREE|nr:uncharacterized protein CC85DRAFT_6187 [Cutaneotrichosporon oleaginosum]KLT46573.1 hypothetical protein CC85DRAFT_6187 [Cutaneotrichosporon oleaginosum]TXT15062.1 hypothetical protein COLE_01255 [Cutaneotrichosporon oleaginosum]
MEDLSLPATIDACDMRQAVWVASGRGRNWAIVHAGRAQGAGGAERREGVAEACEGWTWDGRETVSLGRRESRETSPERRGRALPSPAVGRCNVHVQRTQGGCRRTCRTCSAVSMVRVAAAHDDASAGRRDKRQAANKQTESKAHRSGPFLA